MEGADEIIKLKLIGLNDDTWPTMQNIWDFYSKKGIKTVFLNIGVSTTAYTELEISESLGCPIHIWDAREEVAPMWEEVKQILKDRKRPDSASSFTELAEKKWVLPKNIRLYNGIPSFTNGFTEIHSNQYPTVSMESCVKQMIASMKLTEERIDIMKICLTEGLEKAVLYALMNSPYRPGLLLVEWTTMPDSDLPTTLCAGHLQNCGYSLLANKDKHFTYMYNGDCMYEVCSWETNKSPNPLVAELLNANVAGSRLILE